MRNGETLARGWVEGSTEYDWEDLPPMLQSKMLQVAEDFRCWVYDSNQELDQQIPSLVIKLKGSRLRRGDVERIKRAIQEALPNDEHLR